MHYSTFIDISTDPRNQNESMYTTILASKTQKKIALKLMRALERTGEVQVESKSSVIPCSGDRKACAEETVKYIELQRVTGVVLLSSKELDGFLRGDGELNLQINGENVELDSRCIAEAFKRNQNVRSKILVVVPNGGAGTRVDFLQDVDLLELGEDETTWNKDIVAKFMKKVTLRR